MRYEWTEWSEEQARFEQHLRWASTEVATWPEWKRCLWRPVIPESELPKQDYSQLGMGREIVNRHLDQMMWDRLTVRWSYPFFTNMIS